MTTPSSTFRLPAALVLAVLVSTLAWACASRSAFKPCTVVTSDQNEPGAADTTDGDPAADSTG